MRASMLWAGLSSSNSRQKNQLSLPLITATTAFLVYLFTVSQDITWQNFGGDGGELITASYTLGIPHPPGYPTYIILGKIFSLIPIGTVAGRYNIFSSLCMAVAVGFVSISSLELIRSPNNRTQPPSRLITAGVACGLTLAFLPLVWSQANIAEVYALNMAVLAGLLWTLITNRTPALVGCLLGLAVTTHLTSALFIPMTLIIVPRRSWGKLALGMIIGLLPFILLFIFTAGKSPLVWGQADLLSGWWWLVSAKLYQPNSLALPMDQWTTRLQQWWPSTLVPLMMMTIFSAATVINFRDKPRKRIASLMLLTSFTFVVYAFLHATNDAIVLLLPAFLLTSITLVFAISILGKLSLALPVALLFIGLFVVHSPSSPDVRLLVKQELRQIPADALVITPGDQSIATLWYFQNVEGWRQDLLIVDGNMFQFEWYRNRLDAKYPDLVKLKEDDLPNFISQNLLGRPVCRISLVLPANNACQLPDAP